MKAIHGWTTAAALAVAVLGTAPAPAQAQGEICAIGRGGLMTDLGFDRPARSMRPGGPHGHGELVFESEPRITGVRDEGPAAGRLREGDVLVAVDGEPITTRAGARRYAAIDPGEKVRLSVRRGGDVRDVTLVAVGQCVPHPPAPPAPPAAPMAPAAPAPPAAPLPPQDEIMPEGWLGFAIDCQNCGQDESTGVFRFREPPVVTGVEPGSPAARAGLRPGDRLTHVDGVSLTARAGWPRFYAVQPGEAVRLTYARDGRTHQVTLTALRQP